MYDDSLKSKFVAVLNKRVAVPVLMNALGHLSAGLGARSKEGIEMQFDDYADADGGVHRSISDFAFIVLRADNSNQIRALRKAFIKQGVIFTDFTSTMTVGTCIEQKRRTRETPEDMLEFYGICGFGAREILDPLTKKFSLWR